MKVSGAKLRKAAKLFTKFREEKPTRVKVINFKPPSTVISVGHLECVYYRTTINGKTVRYRHDFDAGSMPHLCVSEDGKQLMIYGGRYKFTEQGIVDRDAKGRLITDPEHNQPLRENPRKNKAGSLDKPFGQNLGDTKMYRKGYAIQKGVERWGIIAGGVHICSASTEVEAKRIIDEELGTA